MFNFECALVCSGLPDSLVNGLSLEKHEPINLELARQQHENYLLNLEKSGLKLITIEPNELYPDCVFVEDTAIAINNRIFITNPGAETRRDETKAISDKLNSIAKELKLEIGEIKNKNESFIDGGDCMFTGKEIIVGLSKRTNLNGLKELEDFFKPIPVISCLVLDNLHLKSSMTMIKSDHILISRSKSAKFVHEQIKQKSNFYNDYKFFEVDEDPHANVLTFNQYLMTPVEFEHVYSNINDISEHENRFKVENSEFKKVDGCLTCRCVLFNKGN